MADINARVVQRRAQKDFFQMRVDQTARTTSMEVEFSSETVKQNNWKRVLHLTYGDIHQDQIRRHARSHYGNGVETDVFRADEVLIDPSFYDPKNKQDVRNLARYQEFIGRYNQSDTEQQILAYERKKETFMDWRFDLGNRFLNLVSRFYRPDPSNKN